jgi:hypothetical protein
MAVTEATKRLIWVGAGGLCSFPDCRRPLVERARDDGAAAQIGKVAHIVGQSEERGPRSQFSVPGLDRDCAGNLMLLCPTCHEVVDQQPTTYTVERLLGVKQAHEEWIRERLRTRLKTTPASAVREQLHSTFFAIDRMPPHIYTAPCAVAERDVRGRIRWPTDKTVLLPFIVRGQQLISFCPLTEPHGPFEDVIAEAGAAERHNAQEWWADPDQSNWYVTLLNRALNKLTGHRGLNLDREHSRYYFEPNVEEPGPVSDENGGRASEEQAEDIGPSEEENSGNGTDTRRIALPREVQYRPMNKSLSRLSVAWQPVRRATGEPRKYWIHRAVGLRFHRVSPDQWILSVRPEHRFTTDGFNPLVPKSTGRRSTSRKSHMYNIDLLHELQFWRDYLSEGAPFINLNFGKQSLVIDAHYIRTDIEWPGVRGDHVKFANATTEFDLFTSAAYHDALAAVDDPEGEMDEANAGPDIAETDDWEIDDLYALVDEGRDRGGEAL